MRGETLYPAAADDPLRLSAGSTATFSVNLAISVPLPSDKCSERYDRLEKWSSASGFKGFWSSSTNYRLLRPVAFEMSRMLMTALVGQARIPTSTISSRRWRDAPSRAWTAIPRDKAL